MAICPSEKEIFLRKFQHSFRVCESGRDLGLAGNGAALDVLQCAPRTCGARCSPGIRPTSSSLPIHVYILNGCFIVVNMNRPVVQGCSRGILPKKENLYWCSRTANPYRGSNEFHTMAMVLWNKLWFYLDCNAVCQSWTWQAKIWLNWLSKLSKVVELQNQS